MAVSIISRRAAAGSVATRPSRPVSCRPVLQAPRMVCVRYTGKDETKPGATEIGQAAEDSAKQGNNKLDDLVQQGLQGYTGKAGDKDGEKDIGASAKAEAKEQEQAKANKPSTDKMEGVKAMDQATEYAETQMGRQADKSQQFGQMAVSASEKEAASGEHGSNKGIKQDNANWGSEQKTKGPDYDPNSGAGKSDPL